MPHGDTHLSSKATRLWKTIEQIGGTNSLIVHDTLQPTMSLLGNIRQIGRRYRRPYYFVSLYFPSTAFFRSRHQDPIWQTLSGAERSHYTRLYTSRMLFEWITTKVADGVIGNSPEICNSLQRYYNYPSVKTCIIPGEIDTARYERIGNAREVIGISGVSPHTKLILYVGSIQARKELQVLLLAFRELRRCGESSVHLVICGECSPEYRGIVNDYFKDPDIRTNVHMMGKRNKRELAYFYSAADCFVHPGRWEGSPRTLKEALAYGCNVVAADIPGTRIIDPDGIFVSYFSPGDHHQLAAAIMGQLGHDSDKKACQRAYLACHFAPTVVAKKYLDFYLRVIPNQS